MKESEYNTVLQYHNALKTVFEAFLKVYANKPESFWDEMYKCIAETPFHEVGCDVYEYSGEEYSDDKDKANQELYLATGFITLNKKALRNPLLCIFQLILLQEHGTNWPLQDGQPIILVHVQKIHSRMKAGELKGATSKQHVK
eukprot:7968951-Ditylum_brightwellii.AAC.1